MPDALDGVHEGGLAEHRLGARARQLDLHLGEHAARPAREHDDAIGHVHRLVDVVRDVDDRLARALPDPEELLLHQLTCLRIERRERLVHQQDRRLHGQRARDPHTLAHAARQLVWVLRLEPREPGHVEVAARAPGALVAGQTHLLQAELDVGLHGAPRE